MDLMGPMQVQSVTGKRYVFVLVDDFTRYTWVRFVRNKSETADSFRIWALQLLNERGGIKRVRSDHGGEFENGTMKAFCEDHGISHQFSAPWTPQQNGVVERKNRTLQEMARAMIHGSSVAVKYWAEALSTACHIINRVYVRKGLTQTPYELWKGKKPNVSYFHVFGSKCFILNERDYLGKFDARSVDGLFMGYSERSTAFRVLNTTTKEIIESVNVVFDEYSHQQFTSQCSDSDSEQVLVEEAKKDDAAQQSEPETQFEPEKQSVTEGQSVEELELHDVPRNHSASDLIGDVNELRKTRGIKKDYHEMHHGVKRKKHQELV